MQLTDMVMAMLGGMIGACFGGVNVFILAPVTALIGVIANSASIAAISFGPLLNPAVTFMAACVAAGYANKRGYNNSNNNVNDIMLMLRKPDVILVAGVAGVLGWICQYYVAKIGLPGLDNVSVAVIVIPLIARVIFEKSVCGVTPESVVSVGGRRSQYNQNCYYPGLRSGGMELTVGGGYGAFIAAMIYLLVNTGMDFSIASFVGFGFGGSLLLFSGVPGNHMVGCSVATVLGLVFANNADYVAANFLSIVIWGAAFGASSLFFADLMGDVWCCYGKTPLDVVASALICNTLVISVVVGLMGVKALWFPIAILAACAVWGAVKDMKWKKYGAEHGLLQS